MEKTVNSYAEALFLIANEENRAEEYLSALYKVCEIFRENPEYKVFLSSYTVSKEKRIEAFEKAFSGILPDRVLDFMCILCDKRKTGDIEEITAEYEKMYFAAENISKASVISAYPLDEKQLEAIKARLEKICGHRVKTEFSVDQALIGGMKIEIDGRVIDSSVRNRLNKLREVMDK